MARFADSAHEKSVRENKPFAVDIISALDNADAGRSPDELLNRPFGRAKFEAHFWALQAGLLRGWVDEDGVKHEVTPAGRAFIREND